MTPEWFNQAGTLVVYLITFICWASVAYVTFIKLLDWWVLAPSRERQQARLADLDADDWDSKW